MAWDTERTRRKIREAALTEFAARGLEGSSMAAIANRAGVNRERLYSYYGDKAALWEFVLADELGRLAMAVELSGTDLDDIGAFAGATYDYHAAHPELARLLQWEGLQSAAIADVAARTLHYREKVARFTEAQASGHLDPDLNSAHLVFALIALAAWWQTVPQLAKMITGVEFDDEEERIRRRAFTVQAARKLATR